MAILALGLSSIASRGAADPPPDLPAIPPPLPWQEPAPLARLFLQLPFEAPEVVPPRTLEVGLRLLYSNTLLSARNDGLALDVHVETAQPTLLVRYGLWPRVEAQLAVPFVADYGGFLDRPIEIVEGWFAFTNPQRHGRPRDLARFHLARPDGSGILRDGPGAGLGDVWAGLKVGVADGGGGNLALRGALKLPTGRLPYGSEELDLGGSLLAGWTWTSTALRIQLDVVVPTADLPAAHVETHPYGTVDLGLTQRLGHRVALQLQASAHGSPLAHTGLDQLDAATSYVLVGATVALSRSVDLDGGIVENVFSPYRGADITFLFGVRARLL
jgi:Protein of unknown function (DUF3187)